MYNISFNNYKNLVLPYQTQSKNTEPKISGNDFNNTNIKPLESDTVEFSKPVDKKSKIKKGFLIGAGVGLSALATVGAVLAVKNHKSKKVITQIYDSVFEVIKKEADELGIDFVKPKILFVRDKKNMAAYCSGQGVITINKNLLNKKNFCALDKAIPIFETDDGKKIYEYILPKKALSKKTLGATKKLTEEQYRLMVASTLQHELTHAKQEQILLNTQGGLEKLFEECKKNGAKVNNVTTKEQFLKDNPFFANYKSKNIFKLDEKRLSKVDYGENRLEIRYTPRQIINCLANYDINNLSAYYNNPLEIEARMHELGANKTLEKAFPDFKFEKDIAGQHDSAKCLTVMELFGQPLV